MVAWHEREHGMSGSGAGRTGCFSSPKLMSLGEASLGFFWLVSSVFQLHHLVDSDEQNCCGSVML